MSDTTEHLWRLLERGFRTRIGILIASIVIGVWIWMLIVQYRYGAP